MPIITVHIPDEQHDNLNKLVNLALLLQYGEGILQQKGDRRYEMESRILGLKGKSSKNPSRYILAEERLKKMEAVVENILANSLSGSSKDKKELRKLFKYFKDYFEAHKYKNDPAKPVKEPSESHKKNIEKNIERSALAYFYDTTWACYERKKRRFGKKIIRFLDYDGNGGLLTEIEDEGRSTVWKGTATYKTVEDFLFITANVDNKYHIHFMIRFNPRATKGNAYVGHMTYNHVDHGNVVTKLVVLSSDDKDAEPSIIELGAKGEMNEAIRTFLLNKDKSRLPSPSKYIYNLDKLAEFVADNPVDGNKVDFLLGNYEVAYKYFLKDKTIKKDKLSIVADVYGKLEATYTYKRQKDGATTFKGQVNLCSNTRIISMYMFSKRDAKYNKPDPTSLPMMLMASDLKLGLQEDEKESFNICAAIITGYRDRDQGIVSRLVIIYRINDDGKPVAAIDDALMHDFFNAFAHKSKVRPPEIYSIGHIRKVVEDQRVPNGKSKE